MTRIMRVALVALACGLATGSAAVAQKSPARAVPAQPATPATPDQDEPRAQSYEGGAGYLPGAQFERKLDGAAGFACTATNARHDQRCTATCQAGEVADCVDADGGGEPSCGCTKG